MDKKTPEERRIERNTKRREHYRIHNEEARKRKREYYKKNALKISKSYLRRTSKTKTCRQHKGIK
jgi:hypothetical protein